MSGTRRRSFEVGHRPKFLVVMDETPECSRALRFAARRAARLKAGLVLLSVAELTGEFEWIGVGDMIRAEAENQAQARLDKGVLGAKLAANIDAETVLRNGEKAEEIIDLIEKDEDISYLVLASGLGNEGPGPLVSNMAGKGGVFPIPTVIVPGDLTDDEIDALAG